MPDKQIKHQGSKTATNKVKSGQKNGKRYSPYSNGTKTTASGNSKRDKSTGQSLKLREDLEHSIDMTEFHQLLEGKKNTGKPKVESRAMKAEVEQLRIEQEARKEFEGTIGSALEAMEKLGAS
jgi:hypothetical protein